MTSQPIRCALITGFAVMMLTACSSRTGTSEPSSAAPSITSAGSGVATSPATSVEPSVATTTQVEPGVPQPPVEFTGRITCGPPVSRDRAGDSQMLDVGDEGIVLTRYRGGAWRQTVTMTDPRLEGTIYETWESDTYAMGGTEEGTGIWAATHRIENEAGAWTGRDYGGTFSDGTAVGADTGLETDDTFATIADSVWIGEGAYAGLIAIIESTPLEAECGVNVRGIIFEGAPVPEPYIP